MSGMQISGTNAYEFLLDPKKDYYIHDNLFEPKNWVRAAE